MTWIEYIGNNKRVRGVTIVAKNAVYYAVEQRYEGEWVALWEARINFGRDKNHRAGGYAFASAAREQKRRLEECAVTCE